MHFPGSRRIQPLPVGCIIVVSSPRSGPGLPELFEGSGTPHGATVSKYSHAILLLAARDIFNTDSSREMGGSNIGIWVPGVRDGERCALYCMDDVSSLSRAVTCTGNRTDSSVTYSTSPRYFSPPHPFSFFNLTHIRF